MPSLEIHGYAIEDLRDKVDKLEQGHIVLNESINHLANRFDLFATRIETYIKSFVIGSSAVATIVGVLYTISWLKVPV